jgi:glycosyltransferase involved in cell wall biosynthesis
MNREEAPRHPRVAVLMPALNEEAALPAILQGIPNWVSPVVVADNGSTDTTPDVARRHGARASVISFN